MSAERNDDNVRYSVGRNTGSSRRKRFGETFSPRVDVNDIEL